VDAALGLARERPRGTVMVVSHADVIQLVLAHVAGAHPDHLHRWNVDTGAISAVSFSDGAPRLLAVNDTGDLAFLRSGRRLGG
jgi:broad specificity phosphatase PhoE